MEEFNSITNNKTKENMATTAQLKNRYYAKTLSEARDIFKAKTGVDYAERDKRYSGGISIYALKTKKGKTATRKYYVGSYMEYINRYY